MSRLLLLAALSSAIACSTPYGSTENPITSQGDCTLTQGYWKNHAGAWPVSSLTLGSVTYSQAQALAVFDRSVQGNGLVSLAHQLMAAKLNVASGASDTVAAQIAAADALIGGLVAPPGGAGALSTANTAALAQALDDYNTGKTGPGHCDGVGKPECVCGDGVIHAGEQCDDGNRIDGDGCSSTCQLEPGGGSGSGSGSGSSGPIQ